jgi:hypothetical protein
MKYLIIIFLLSAACMQDITPCSYMFAEAAQYKINSYVISNTGLKIDDETNSVDIKEIDKIFTTVYDCLLNEFPDRILHNDVLNTSWCYNERAHIREIEICKDCISIKIPNNYSYSITDPNEQVLADTAPKEGCLAKGQNRDFKKYPCKYRGLITEDNIIVVTPSLHLLPDMIVKYASNCSYPYGSDKLSKCIESY